MVKVLAITVERCSGSAILVDDKIAFSSSEERYSRKKSDASYPINSMNDGLQTCNLDAKDLDQVVICGNQLSLIPSLLRVYSSFSVKDQIKTMEEYWYPKLVKKEQKNFVELFQSKIDSNQYPFNTEWGKQFDYSKLENPVSLDNAEKVSVFLKKTISSHLGIDESKISHMEHDLCHASYAFYGSPLRDDNTLVLTADAWGDDLSATISIYDKSTKRINRVREYHHKDFQLARLYRYTTLVLRMLSNEHEYKVMGLAPYYNGPAIRDVEKVYEEMQYLDGLDFKFNKNIPDMYDHLQRNLRFYRFDHIAAGLQSFTEKILVNWITNIIKEYGTKSVVFSGGVSMNVKANMKISQIPQIEKFFVCGAGTDETLPMGACYHFAELNGVTPKPLQTLYLGSEAKYSQDDLNLFEKHKITKLNNTDQIVEKLLENKIVATCIGRMEMGQRALGNRSILADPRQHSNIEKINKMIKNRDFWMPFAPIVLYEYQHEILENPKKIESPFMTVAFDTKKGKEKIPAAVHQADGTARPQILKKEENPIIWEVIKKFYDKTGIPVLLNTSFNLHGEPIVRTIADAARVFDNSGLDVVWLDNHIVEKRN